MTIQSIDLLADLGQRTKHIIQTVEEKFTSLSTAQLNKKPSPEAWSIIECLEHLNRYGDYYLVEIKEKMQESNKAPSSNFKSGVLGNYFANMMLVKENKVKKMATFKNMNPAIIDTVIASNRCNTIMTKFLNQQKEMLKLLEEAQKKHLKAIKTPITIAPWLRLRLGDTFRFVIYHNERHVWQAERVLK